MRKYLKYFFEKNIKIFYCLFTSKYQELGILCAASGGEIISIQKSPIESCEFSKKI